MLSRVVIKKQRGRRVLTVLAATGLVAGILLAYGAVLAAIAPGVFELDGNAVTSHTGTGAPDDWDRVCYTNAITPISVDGTGLGLSAADATTKCFGNGDTATPTGVQASATAVSWVDATLNQRIFVGGGSKDPQDPQDSWLWKPADTGPDKDAILHGFAARYSLNSSATCPGPGGNTDGTTKCEVIFFGSDRFDNAGDAQLGFWFFKNKISTTDTASNGGFKFDGHHANGDLLLVSDFSNGGGTSTISAYFWDNTCGSDNTAANKIYSNPVAQQCAANNLRLQLTSTAASCSVVGPTGAFCGIANPNFANDTTHQIAPWSFKDKKANTGVYDQNEFYEAGVNLSGLGIGGECFSSFDGESRASTSATATLKRFVLGGFGHCESELVTTPSVGSGGTSITTTGRISVTDSADLTVTGAQTWTGTLKFYLCGPLTTGTCDGVTNVGTLIDTKTPTSAGGNHQTIVSTAATISSAGDYCWRGEFTSPTAGVPPATDGTAGECFTVNPVTPTISTTATATVVLGNPIDDTATLLGTAPQPGSPVINGAIGSPAGGTITFKLYGPSATANCTANLLATSVVNVSGDSVTPTNLYKASNGTITGTLTPTVVGNYWWTASYSGNSPNTNSKASACDDTGEKTTVTGTASTSSAQSWLPNDHVTVTGDTSLNGTLTVTLYPTANCTGTPVPNQSYTKTFTSATSPQTFDTSNGVTNTFKVTTANPGSYSWLIHYDDSSLSDPADHCETSTVSPVTD